jgi:hypothetical protein
LIGRYWRPVGGPSGSFFKSAPKVPLVCQEPLAQHLSWDVKIAVCSNGRFVARSFEEPAEELVAWPLLGVYSGNVPVLVMIAGKFDKLTCGDKDMLEGAPDHSRSADKTIALKRGWRNQ